ncbi:MAG: NADH-quinone oxidoreductase subunit M [Chloroflexaceae bacterium]|nr:NADH-quinone oxidoreductase subunit M [Chloroflexaceae bacterium]
MNMLTLPPTIPILSLIWLSMVLPVALIAVVPASRATLIRVIGTGFALLSLVLSVLVFLAYDQGQSGFQFVEQLAWIPQLGIAYYLGVDGITVPLLLLNGLVIFTGALMSWNIAQRIKEYWILLLLLTAGVYGVFVALDLFLLFVFYELAVLPMYLLIGVWGSTRREYGAMKLTLFLMAGSALALIGMLAIYFGSGLRTFDIPRLAANVNFEQQYQVLFFLPLFIGFAVLAGMFPFHTWSPTGHVAAPTAVSMLHAGVLMKLGAYACLRIALWLMPHGAAEWLPAIAILTIFNVVYGATIAMVQRDAKFMIGYSSVSHMGLVMMALAAGTQIALTGAVLQMFAHGIMTALFFSVVGRMVYERTHTRQLGELGGLGRVMPFAAVMFIIAGLSGMGMPGLAGFWAEFTIFIGVWERYPLLAIIAVISIPVTAAYVLHAIYRVFYADVDSPHLHDLPPLTWQEITGALILAAVLIGVGFAPGILTDMIAAGVRPIAQQLQGVGW